MMGAGAVAGAESLAGSEALAVASSDPTVELTPTPADLRAGAWLLLGDLLLRGPVDELAEPASASPILEAGWQGSEDERLAQHEHAFGQQAWPHEGVYLGASCQAGEDGDGLADLWEALGLDVRGDADHLATHLRALAWLAQAEAEAVQDGKLGEAHRITALERRVFDEHLLRWLPAWGSAVRRLRQPWPSALARQILDLALLRRAELGGATERFRLPPLDVDLASADTGLSDLAVALVAPGRAGILLTRDDLRTVARAVGAPGGFGDRRLILTGSLRSSARFDSLVALLAGLAALYADWKVELAGLRTAHPWLEPCLHPWMVRVDEALAMLAQIEEAAAP
jgi:TorA maturation chaperone TorD